MSPTQTPVAGDRVVDDAPVVPPHPRIRQRRVEVKRDEGRRRLRVVVLTLAAAAIAGATYGATRSPLLDVDTVGLRGATQTSQADVLRVSGLDEKPAMTDVDEARVEARVETLPWVAHATVVRHYPGTVEVTLQERIPIATVPGPNGVWATVDLTGRVLAQAPQAPADMTRIEAPAAGAPGTTVGASTRAALRVVDALPEVVAGRVPIVRVSPSGTIDLLLDGKVPVHVGAPTQVEEKLVALATLVQKADLRGAKAIDVRVPTAPVLTHG